MRKLLITVCIIGFSQFLFGQDAPPPAPAPPPTPKNKKGEEIVIRNKSDKEMNMTIQINGDSITVNGKPLYDYKDADITINKRKMMVRDGDKMMRFDGNEDFNMNDWMKSFNGKEESSAFLGVTTEKAKDGVKIEELTVAGAAEKAGLKEGDIIIKVDDDYISNPETLSAIIKSKKPQQEIRVTYKRGGKENSMKVKLGERKEKITHTFTFDAPMMRSFNIPGVPPIPDEMDEDEVPYMADMADFGKPSRKKIGIKIQDTEDGKVKVINVEDSSTAATAGIKTGDIIYEIDGDKIDNTDQAREQLHPEEGKLSYNIKVNRNGKEMSFDVKIPRKLKTANL